MGIPESWQFLILGSSGIKDSKEAEILIAK
jgi:hypothetical protein